MQASLIIYVCSETLMLLALQHRKLRHHFYVTTLDIFALSFFFLSKHSNSKQSPKYPWNASLSHCSSAPYLPGLCAPRYTRLPGRFCCLAPICSKDAKRIVPKDETQHSPPQPHNMARSREVTCVFGDTGGKPSTSVLTLLRLLITGLTVLLTADSLLCLL